MLAMLLRTLAQTTLTSSETSAVRALSFQSSVTRMVVVTMASGAQLARAAMGASTRARIRCFKASPLGMR